jgi:lysozyme family protein
MADFTTAVNVVLGNEGGFVDTPNDSGGATNFGISLRFLRDVPIERLRKYGIFKLPEELNVEDIKDLTADQARLIYKGEFWDHARFDEIQNQKCCTYIFDMAVNHGITQAIKIAQRSTWAAYAHINLIKDDGVLGSETLSCINSLKEFCLPTLMAERAGFMRLIAAKNSKDEEFLHGWLSRCYRE